MPENKPANMTSVFAYTSELPWISPLTPELGFYSLSWWGKGDFADGTWDSRSYHGNGWWHYQRMVPKSDQLKAALEDPGPNWTNIYRLLFPDAFVDGMVWNAKIEVSQRSDYLPTSI